MPGTTFVATNAFSKALITVMLPMVSDFSAQLGLDVVQPVTEAHVRKLRQSGPTSIASCILTNGYLFDYCSGRIYSFSTPSVAKIDRGEMLGGVVRLSRNEALEKLRASARNLGIAELNTLIELTPEVEEPCKFGGKMSAFYTIRFYEPNSLNDDVGLEAIVNADSGKLEMLRVAIGLWPPSTPPALQPFVEALPKPQPMAAVAPDLSHFLQGIQPQLERFSAAVGIRLQNPLTTNAVSVYSAVGTPRGECEELRLTNELQFLLHDGRVFSYATNDMFFSEGTVGIQGFVGKWRLTRSEAVNVARKAVRRLGNKELIALSSRSPEIKEPKLIGRRDVPRLYILWENATYEIAAEVDAEHGRLVLFHVLPAMLWK